MGIKTDNGGMTIEAPFTVAGSADPNAPDPGTTNPDETGAPMGVDGAGTTGQEGGDTTAPTAPGDQPGDSDEVTDAVAGALKAVGLDMNAFTQEFTEQGGLSEESFTKLEKAGFPRPLVEQYLAGAKVNQTLAKEQENEIKGIVGGPEAYQNVTAWAAENLTADEVAAYNDLVASGDIRAIKFAVAGLKARFDAAAGPTLIHGITRASATSTDIFRSSAEVVAAMRDPRYGKDAAYTRDIEQKLGRSDVF